MSDNENKPTFTFPEITVHPPDGYHRDKRFKLGEAGEKFIQRHVTQARELVATFSDPPTKANNLQYGVFKDEKFAQWKSNGLATDADTQTKFERKWNNIRNQIVSQRRFDTVAKSTPASVGLTPPPYLASTINAITARSIFNEEHGEAHKAAVIRDRRTKDEGSKQHVGRLAALRATEWRSLTPAQQAQYEAKAEAERERIYGDVEACQMALLNTIRQVVTAAVGTKPGQVGHAGFAFQFMFNTKDGKRRYGGAGLGECDRFGEAPEFKDKLLPVFYQFAKDHVSRSPPAEVEPGDLYEGVFPRNELGHYLLPEIEDDELFSEYRAKLKLFLMAYWSLMFPAPGPLATIPWDDIYRSPTSFFVDSIIPVGSPHMDRIEDMTCSSMIKLADRIRLVQSSNQPSIFRAKADILRVLRNSPSEEAIAPEIPNEGVTIIDVEVPSVPPPPHFDSSGDLPSVAPESSLTRVRTPAIKPTIPSLAANVVGSNGDITKSPLTTGSPNTSPRSAKRKSETLSEGAPAFAGGTRCTKKPRLSGVSNERELLLMHCPSYKGLDSCTGSVQDVHRSTPLYLIVNDKQGIYYLQTPLD
ncbi:HMG box domain-containing protein [Pleurotus pulmonarius]